MIVSSVVVVESVRWLVLMLRIISHSFIPGHHGATEKKGGNDGKYVHMRKKKG